MHEREVKLTRLTCVWLYDATGGKVVSNRWQLYQMRENPLCTRREGRPSTRGGRETEKQGGREGGEGERCWVWNLPD